MKILFFVSSMHAGGAERVAATLASAWAQRGDAVTLVCSYSGRGTCFYPLHERVQIRWLADYLAQLRWAGPLKKLWAMRRLVRETQPDVIVSFLTNVNVTVLLATRGLATPVFVCERTDPLYGDNVEPILAHLRRWTYPWADQVVVQTRQSVDHLKQVAARVRRVSVIPNPLPPDLPAARQREPVQTGRFILMAMGRLHPVKQFNGLIEVFGSLADRYPDWDLEIWGEGPMREALVAQTERLGLSARVRLPGRTTQPWIVMQRAHAFVLSSRVEGFPNTLLEAMALGLPCVALDCPSGPSELADEGRAARLVPMDDACALGAALAQLMGARADWREARGAQAAASVRGRYSLDQVLQRWDEVLCQK
ncbi:glycosyltransferase family 4 protein [Alcaligenaceae bacterium CGII-47]|nr:glycosyltransferase family 4 protein [Alcaligenaceae bacterium CGII-47]